MEVDSYFLVSMSIIQCQVRLNRLRKLVYICTRVIPIRLSWRENSMDLWFWFNVISYVDASLLSYLVYVYISKKKIISYKKRIYLNWREQKTVGLFACLLVGNKKKCVCLFEIRYHLFIFFSRRFMGHVYNLPHGRPSSSSYWFLNYYYFSL